MSRFAWESHKRKPKENPLLEKNQDIMLFNCRCGGTAEFYSVSKYTLAIAVKCNSCGLTTSENKQAHRTASQWNKFATKERFSFHVPEIKFKLPVGFNLMGMRITTEAKTCVCGNNTHVLIHDTDAKEVSVKCNGCNIETDKAESIDKAISSWNF